MWKRLSENQTGIFKNPMSFRERKGERGVSEGWAVLD